ncbi:MAG TPA: hypothetical protein DHV36_25740 [Desulfobacteraceae bacterium]|nr:hypothetical protein [Desulfobacteraceae bacterium]
MKRHLFILCLLFQLIVAAWATPAAAEKPLVFVGDDHFPPYSWEEKGKISGIDVDIIRELWQRLDIAITIRLAPWKRLIHMTRTGQCDGSFSLFHTRARESFAHYAFARPIHISRFPLFYRKGSDMKFDTITDLFGKTIGVNRGFAISDAFDAAVESGKILVNIENNVDKNIFLTANGRIDGFTNNFDVTLYKLKHLPRMQALKDLIVHSEKSISELRNAYLVLSRQSRNIPDKPLMIERINKALEQMAADGVFLKINQKYLN